MAIHESLLLGLLVLLTLLDTIQSDHHVSTSLNRCSFPQGFVFGTATAAYQVEGAVDEGGRGPSIWDDFTHKWPERIAGKGNGDKAVDFYHRYKEDIKEMKEMNMDAFRFSISWTRILPYGKLHKGINKEGVKFYNNLINDLLANDLEPFVTIFHWDLPQALEEEYEGFRSHHIVADFRNFARLCFQLFGDRVKYWMTLNEPGTYSVNGYHVGNFAPGRCSKWVNAACKDGNSSTEPYVVGYHLLLSHAAAVKEYRKYYQRHQKGKIGIVLSSIWAVPFSESEADREAAKRKLDFTLGWFLNPITYGDYPENMWTYVKDRLPRFTRKQSQMLKGSYDFLGINYYSGRYAANKKIVDPWYLSYGNDSHVEMRDQRNGVPIGPPSASDWLFVYPEGIRDLLKYIKDTYNRPTIYISENGIDEYNNNTLTREEALKDPQRINYYNKHLQNVRRAIFQDEVDVRGFFAWSLLDNFEWADGYEGDLNRYPKHSVLWFRDLLWRTCPSRTYD